MAEEKDKTEDSGDAIDPFKTEDKAEDGGKKAKGTTGNYGEWNRAHTKMQDMLSDDVIAVMSGKEKNILDGLDEDEDSEAESEDEEE